jgi:hypothetical protein
MHFPSMLLLLASACLMATPVLAQHVKSAVGPHAIGYFEDWAAAIHLEAGDTVCYAFTRASVSTPTIAGRGDAVLTVAERPGGGRDVVAFSAGFAFSRNAAVAVSVEPEGAAPFRTEFYTTQRSGFARDGHAAVLAFQRGRLVVARSPGPNGRVVSDHFSLRGFSAAYAAIVRACPPSGKP